MYSVHVIFSFFIVVVYFFSRYIQSTYGIGQLTVLLPKSTLALSPLVPSDLLASSIYP
jgi:hypothetical protein